MAEPHRVAVTLEQLWHRVPGGTATSALESLRALGQSGELDLVGVAARHRRPPLPAFTSPVPVRSLPMPRSALYESWHRWRWPPVQWATGPVDVIHATGMAVPPPSAPLVVTVHDLAFVHEPGHFTRRGLRFFHRAIELAARDGDILVCPSRATRDDAVAYGLPADRLRLVPWGLEARSATGSEVKAVRARYGLPDRFVLWVGTLEPRKNLPGLLAAMAHLIDRGVTDGDLVLAGPQGWHEDIGAGVARLGRRVHVLGFVPATHLTALYRAATVFCFPSFREGFGLPVLEAMAQGTPVVTSAGTAMAELVGEDESGAGILVDPRDPNAIANGLAEVLGDPARAERWGEAARNRARDFSWARTAAGLRAAYQEAAGAGSLNSPPKSSVSRLKAPAARTHRPVRRRRIGLNLLWCVPGQVGGSEEYTVRLLRAVAEADPGDLEPVLFANRRFAAAYPDLTDHFASEAAPVSGSSRGARVLAEATWLAATLRQRRIDVTHHLGGTIPLGPTPAPVVTIHDLQPLALPERFSPLKRTYLRVTIPRSCRLARQVVALSRFVLDDIVVRTGVARHRCHLVPPGLDPVDPVTDAELGSVRRRYGLGDRPFFIYPAIPYAHKGHLDLLEAFTRVVPRCPDTLLVLPGGIGPLDADLEAFVRQRGLGAEVRRLGRIPWADLDALYRTAVAMVFPSRYEGFGMPALEAMTRGCPVIASRVGGLAEVVGEGGVLVDPAATVPWAEAMVSVLEQPRRREQLRAAGRRRAGEFDWSRSTDSLFGVWRAA